MSLDYDPLSTSSPFATSVSNSTPAWSTAQHSPESPQSNAIRRPVTPTSPLPPHAQSPHSPPATGPFGKEPQIYGQPSPGLISPGVGSNGTKYERNEPYLRVRITGLDRNRKDILLRLDAQTNLPNFNGSTYRNVTRSYADFQRFAEQIVYSNPHTIVDALPLPQTSAPSDEEDDRLVRIMLQRWITRVCEDPILLKDEDVRSFIESDFGYQPNIRPRRKTGAGFSLLRRGIPDEDEQLASARLELTKLEMQFFEAAKAIDKLSRARKVLATFHTEMGNKLLNVATTESHPPLASAVRKFARTWHSLGDLEQAEAISECVILGDALGYQGLNARAAKETLQQRTQVLEEYQTAVKSTISKRRQIERLKASTSIRPEKVEEVLEDMEEATKVEQLLARRVDGISQNLRRALSTHSRHAHDDVTHALIEHARSSVMYERQLLRELEALRPDVAGINKQRPAAVPVPAMPPSPVPTNGVYGAPPVDTVSHPNFTSKAGPSSPPVARHPTVQGLWNEGLDSPIKPSASNGHGAPSPAGPLGGRIVDGTKSMFISPANTSFGPQSPGPSNQDPLSSSVSTITGTRPIDNLGRANTMGRSMTIQPPRRLDAREAASKLANFL